MTTLTDKHIVLDLDSTMIHSTSEMNIVKELNSELETNSNLRNQIYFLKLVDATKTEGTGSVEEMWGVFRPGVFRFLEFCFRYFKGVHVWSAGRRFYVHAIVTELFKMKKPHNIFTYDDCDFNKNESTVCKNLSKIFKSDNHYGANKRNTFALDDRDDTFSKNVGNGILIPRFEPELTVENIMADEISLLQLQLWLMQPEVVRCTDVRKLDKNNIFKTPIERLIVGLERYLEKKSKKKKKILN